MREQHSLEIASRYSGRTLTQALWLKKLLVLLLLERGGTCGGEHLPTPPADELSALNLLPCSAAEEPSVLLLEEEDRAERLASPGPPMSASSIAHCVLDVDEERVDEHLVDVAFALKAEVRATCRHKYVQFIPNICV
jgi:hypothetical protein